METTAYDILENIARLVSETETRALFGERQYAFCLIRQAEELYVEFRTVISPFPDAAILDERIATIATKLCAEMNAKK